MSHYTPSLVARSGVDFKVRNMISLCRHDVHIALDSSQEHVKSFSTLDSIKGTVTITPRSNLRFDHLDIAFVGTVKTYVSKLGGASAMNGRSEAIHRFLRLKQPIHDDQLPQPRILEAGKPYQFPFTFVVPPQLLPRACTHQSFNEQVHDAHLQLPPSLGDPDSSALGCLLLDDLAPDMARISYAIEARLLRSRDNGKKPVMLAEGSKKLRITPSTEELPPLSVEGREDEYCLRKEKVLRKGLFKGKLGSLVMEASQPKSFRLPAAVPDTETRSASTFARVKLRFDPQSEDNPPPRLMALTSRLKVSTHFSTTARKDFPKKENTLQDLSTGTVSQTIPLSTLCIASVEWKRNSPSRGPTPSSDADRRFSALSGTSCFSGVSSSYDSVVAAAAPPAPSTSSHPLAPFYTATILVPLSLPASKTLVPTFHNCLVSRTYALHLALSIDGPGHHHMHRLTSPLLLRVPVQVAADASVLAQEHRRTNDLAQQAIWDADAAFEPRTVGLHAGTEATENGSGGDRDAVRPTAVMEAPPGYDVPGFSITRRVSVFG